MNKHFLIIPFSFFAVTTVAMEKRIVHYNNPSKKLTVHVNRNTNTGIAKPRINHDRGITQQPAPRTTTEQKVAVTPQNNTNRHNFIYDQYTQRRGAPKMLALYCDDCNQELIRYQKDGPGRLLRCYLDRIHSPENFKNRQYDDFNVRTSPNLSCPTCRLIIGKPMIYKSENRPAYHLTQGCSYFKEIKN